jgi:hypothetical protein
MPPYSDPEKQRTAMREIMRTRRGSKSREERTAESAERAKEKAEEAESRRQGRDAARAEKNRLAREEYAAMWARIRADETSYKPDIERGGWGFPTDGTLRQIEDYLDGLRRAIPRSPYDLSPKWRGFFEGERIGAQHRFADAVGAWRQAKAEGWTEEKAASRAARGNVLWGPHEDFNDLLPFAMLPAWMIDLRQISPLAATPGVLYRISKPKGGTWTHIYGPAETPAEIEWAVRSGQAYGFPEPTETPNAPAAACPKAEAPPPTAEDLAQEGERLGVTLA